MDKRTRPNRRGFVAAALAGGAVGAAMPSRSARAQVLDSDAAQVATVSELKRKRGMLEGDVAWVHSYAFPGDGGGGVYVLQDWVSLRANIMARKWCDDDTVECQWEDLIYVECADDHTLRWVLQHEGSVSVAQFGVDPVWLDGQENRGSLTRRRIERAIYFASLHGARVVIPPATYHLDGPLEMYSYADVSAHGAHLILDKAANHFIHITNPRTSGVSTPLERVHDVRWSGGVIDCSNAPGANGFGVSEASRVLIQDVEVRGCVFVLPGDGTTSERPNADPIHSTKGGRGITFHPGSVDCRAVNCFIRNCDVGLHVGSVFSQSKPEPYMRSRGISFENCRVSGSRLCGFAAEQNNMNVKEGHGGQGISVIGCEFRNCASVSQSSEGNEEWRRANQCGVILGGAAAGVSIVGCRVHNDEYHPIKAVVRGSFIASDIDLNVDVWRMSELITSQPHHLENDGERTRIHNGTDPRTGSYGLNLGSVFRVHAMFNECHRVIRGARGYAGAAHDLFDNCRFDITLARRGPDSQCAYYLYDVTKDSRQCFLQLIDLRERREVKCFFPGTKLAA